MYRHYTKHFAWVYLIWMSQQPSEVEPVAILDLQVKPWRITDVSQLPVDIQLLR